MSEYQTEVTEATLNYLSQNRKTRKALAKSLKMTPQNLSQRLTGVRKWNVKDVYALAHLGVEVPPLDGDRQGQ